MFLFERVFGIAIYSYFLLMTCILMAYTNVKHKTILKIYTVILCVMGFFYLPYETADLYRTFETMDWYASIDFPQFLNDFVRTSSVPISRILYWLVGKSGIYGLLPVISAFVSYSCIFYTIDKTQEIYSISRKNVAITLFFLMSTSMYISVIGGIRMMMAMSLIVFCFFRESVEQKFRWWNVLLYVTAVFMHDIALILVAIRFIALVLDSKIKLVIRIVLSAFIIGVGTVMIFVFNYQIEQVFEKIVGYITGDNYSYIWEYMIGAIIAFTYLLIVYRFKKYKNNNDYGSLKAYNIAAVISGILSILFCFEFSIFYRFIGHVVPLLGMPMMMVSLQESQNAVMAKKKQISFQTILLVLSIAIFALSCTRGSLCSLKFFVLS